MCFWMAQRIREIAGPVCLQSVFRQSQSQQRHFVPRAGLEEGLRILGKVRELGIPVLTDIHEPSQAEPAAECVDILQIPAFLCRQTDLLLAAGEPVAPSTLKKGSLSRPPIFANAAEKVASTGNDKIILTERGSSFGYNNLVVDMRGLRHHGRDRLSGGFRRHAQRTASGCAGMRPAASPSSLSR